MKWLEDMNRALDYVEDNLTEKTDYEKIARIACCSVYHFQRMFTFITGVTMSEYIRRRKMTMAAFDLQNSDIRVTELAFKYGYESPEAFSRAFQNLHGITPTAARERGAKLQAFPRISFQITVKGANRMNYRIVEKEAFEVYGIEGVFDTADDRNLKEVPAFWLKSWKEGACAKLIRSAGCSCTIHSICQYREMKGTAFPYMLSVMKTPLSDTTGYTQVSVPKATWAVFENEPHRIEETASHIQDLTYRIYTEWLPTANYELKEGYDIEMYYSLMDGRYYEEVWIRVVPKE